jgi:hypothetical protein
MKSNWAATRLDFFPTSFPDETLHSRLARYHLLSGNLDDRLTLQELFGSHTLIATSLLPSHLNALIQRLPVCMGATAESILQEGTIFPYYRPFLFKSSQVQRCLTSTQSTDARDLKIRLGMVASRLGGQNPFRFCNQCLAEDVGRYGVGYWHRTHQLPGVLVCARHGCVLSATDRDWVRLRRHKLFLPMAAPLTSCARDGEITDQQYPELLSLARLSAQALEFAQQPLSGDLLRSFYLHVAGSRGWLTSHGRVRSSAIRTVLKSCDRLFPDVVDFAFLRYPDVDAIKGKWMLMLLRDRVPGRGV